MSKIGLVFLLIFSAIAFYVVRAFYLDAHAQKIHMEETTWVDAKVVEISNPERCVPDQKIWDHKGGGPTHLLFDLGQVIVLKAIGPNVNIELVPMSLMESEENKSMFNGFVVPDKHQLNLFLKTGGVIEVRNCDGTIFTREVTELSLVPFGGIPAHLLAGGT